ncbi:MAG TPA: PIG-L deacetylase family protein [Polyangiales bacterium]|nr:PIG-L deacetylase family protein [Polyangiales bacterium]
MTRDVLAVFAHPDDEVLCGAGTLALCASRGVRVHLVCATRGELGPIASPELATHETLAAVREGELRASCAALGITEPEFLDLPDAGVDWAAEDAGTLRVLTERIRELRPAAILTFGPDGLYGHADHVAIGELTTQAREAAGVPTRLFYAVTTGDDVAVLLEGAKRAGVPDSLWSLGPQHFAVPKSEITCSVDVSAVLDQKLAALRCHRTQLQADNVLAHLTPALARGFFVVEHFRCADKQPGTPLSALGSD